MRRFTALLLALPLAVSLAGCVARREQDSGKLQVVCSLFP